MNFDKTDFSANSGRIGHVTFYVVKPDIVKVK